MYLAETQDQTSEEGAYGSARTRIKDALAGRAPLGHSDPQPRRRVNRRATRRQTQSCPGSGGFPSRRRCRVRAAASEAAARLVDDSLVLVEPDRNPRPDAQKKAVSDPAFRLRERPRTGVVDAAERAPCPGKVAIEVDAVGVLASAGRVFVRVQVVDHREIQ